MGSEQANRSRAGYRTIMLLLLVGCAGIGFTRLEERGIIGVPGSAANAMAALATSPDERAGDESYDGAPEDVVTLERTRLTPGNRIRRLLTDRSLPSAAARQIITPGPGAADAGSENLAASDPTFIPEQALVPVTASTPAFASLAPTLPGTGTPVFAADVTPPGGGSGSSGGGGGGSSSGGGTTQPPASPVPEPATWLFLMLGLFAIGAAMRRAGRVHLSAI